MIVLMVTTGVGLGLVGGWFGFRWRHKGRVFSETDREYFQNLLYRSESAEAKLETMQPELDRTRDRAKHSFKQGPVDFLLTTAKIVPTCLARCPAAN